MVNVVVILRHGKDKWVGVRLALLAKQNKRVSPLIPLISTRHRKTDTSEASTSQFSVL